ncbi:unnamed protein product [Musa acuminata subsp. malaccensis]|uniref:(wild Malaysian banana) hypothetical protein n=1 Tax=Musa acuminata subsp. malaccensis TaxID=214687 RepID=A0A804IZB2_MUSAM|nr:unnamed protein product [Musa acuminata subsp. malaccensis]
MERTKAIDEADEGDKRGYRQRWAKLRQWTKPLRATDVRFRFCFWYLLLGQAREGGVRVITLVGSIEPTYSSNRPQARNWPNLARALTRGAQHLGLSKHSSGASLKRLALRYCETLGKINRPRQKKIQLHRDANKEIATRRYKTPGEAPQAREYMIYPETPYGRRVNVLGRGLKDPKREGTEGNGQQTQREPKENRKCFL